MGKFPGSLQSRVYLLVTGFDQQSMVTDHLGLNPTEAWDVGDSYIANGTARTHRNSKWMYGEADFSTVDENSQLDLLISRLTPYQLQLRSTPAKWLKSLVVVHETDSPNADLALTPSEISFAASINAGFWIDVYSLPKVEPGI